MANDMDRLAAKLVAMPAAARCAMAWVVSEKLPPATGWDVPIMRWYVVEAWTDEPVIFEETLHWLAEESAAAKTPLHTGSHPGAA